MKKKSAYISTFIILAGLLYVGCAKDGGIDRNMHDSVLQAVSVPESPLLTHTPTRDTGADIAKRANQFSFNLAAARASKNDGDNLILSPISVWLPLASLVSATDDAYVGTLLEALCLEGSSVEEVNDSALSILNFLMNQNSPVESYNPLQIANAIFVDNKVTIKPDYMQSFADFYHGTAFNVDFTSRDAVRAVNRWASDHTEGLIEEVIDEFSPDTIVAIANAIYFSDRWQWEFDTKETMEGVFHSPTAEESAHFMVREGPGQAYYEDEYIQAVQLKFLTGGGMYIMLPKDGNADALLSSMTEDYFDAIRSSTAVAEGKLLLPRFSIDSDIMSLTDTLTNLGIPLFDATGSPITGLVEEDIPLWLSGAVQRAAIAVDEKGTTAAAVTVIQAAGSGLPAEPLVSFEMTCDRSFVFILYANTNYGVSQVLFTGIVNHV